jgi:hypothetical protein
MAVGCEVLLASGSECGVGAIGRCSDDGRAFCMTHRGRSGTWVGRGVGTPQWQVQEWSDLCAPCCERREAEARKRAEEQEAEERRLAEEKETRYGEAYLINSARRDLIAAKVPAVEIYSKEHEVIKKLFGGRESVERVKFRENGWILGEFVWEYQNRGPYGGTDGTEKVLTALLCKDLTPKPEFWHGYWKEMFVTVAKDAERDLYLMTGTYNGSWNLIRETYSLSAAIQQLSGKYA